MRLLIAAVVLTLGAAACTGNQADDGEDISSPAPPAGPSREAADTTTPSYAGTVPAPEFPDGLDWLNTAAPLRLESLRGKIVLLDFWTYGCINCIHIIPDLKRLEQEYEGELVVIGVHSAKFLNESETENIRQIVLRYEIEHPVVNDKDFAVWRSWGAQAWPTVALVDPAGKVVGMHSGEGVYATVQPVIDGLRREFSDSIDRTKLNLTLESATQTKTVLSFPGKVAATPDGATIFVADTGHHRIIAADPSSGEITAVYGSGRPGFENGPALLAQFQAPQGLAFDETTRILYVADTANHAIRAIDTATGRVDTLTGTGQQGWPPAAGLLPDARLNSPWGLTFYDEKLWVAMAGSHQLWVIDVAGGIATPAVGSAIEGVANGPLTAAELAQPSGLVFGEDGRLYFADAESSAVRWAEVNQPGGVTGTLSGSDANLFDFGDEDGEGTAARLQHPLGIVWDPASRRLIVADTYNSKLKKVDPVTGSTTTYLGGEQGWADGTTPLFYEPGGLAIAGTTLFVADTNNHVIRVVDLETDTADTLVLHGIESFTPPPDAADYPGSVVFLDEVEVGAGPGEIVLDVQLPPGYKVNEDAPSSVVFRTSGIASITGGDQQSITGAALPVGFDVAYLSGRGTVTAEMTLLYCREDSEGLCLVEQVHFSQPVTVAAEAQSTIRLPYTVVLPGFAEP